MSLITNALVVCVLCVSPHSTHTTNRADDFQLGNIASGELGYQETVKLGSIPLTTRTKNVFYNSNNTKIIKGISAVDMEKSKAKVTITAGGVGLSFVNLRLNSQKGKNLRYLVQVFV